MPFTFCSAMLSGEDTRYCPRRFLICTYVSSIQSPTRGGGSHSKTHEATPGMLRQDHREVTPPAKIIPGTMKRAEHALSKAGFAPTQIAAPHVTCSQNGPKTPHVMLLSHANHQGQDGILRHHAMCTRFPTQQQKRSAACGGPETLHLRCLFKQMTRCVPHNAISLNQQVPERKAVHAGRLGVCFGYDLGMLPPVHVS